MMRGDGEFVVELVSFDAAGEGVAEAAARSARGVAVSIRSGAAGGVFEGGGWEVAGPEAFGEDCDAFSLEAASVIWWVVGAYLV